ncbi:hypothetical protein [uncultured Polaribacter sp.]|uniref:leucine-rich repeat domain-containing protein n=1 Tax=uncultured Polaribacter sp. TaxID=174711 RepID=UPI00261B62EF|nr:hypothetical protein [uncultured Polaribacter sp.]
MSKVSGLILLCCILLLQNCNIYKRSFGETYNTTKVENFNKIFRLDLSNTSTQNSPKNLQIFTALRMLNLSGNKQLNLDEVFKNISNTAKLEVLILDSLDLKLLPKSILKLKNLKHLSLNNNPNLNLKQAFQIIKGLPIQFLNLQHNNLENIPTNIANISSLTSINLSHNNLNKAAFYRTLAKLPKLNSLWLTNNHIANLSKEIGSLNTLRNLYLEHNKLTTLPNSIKNLKKVNILHLGYNNFTALPKQLIGMPTLILLHINNCKINKIPSEFYNTKYSLKSIILDNNNLSKKDKSKWRKAFKSFIMASF